MIETIDITYGLPASGKTDWSKDQLKGRSYRNSVYHIELDNYLYGYDHVNRKVFKNSISEFKELVSKDLKSYFDDRSAYSDEKSRLIIDGLFTTNESLVELIDMIKSFKVHYKKVNTIRIIRFNSNIDKCIWNAKGRFDRFGEPKNTDISIKNMKFEKLNWVILKSAHRNTQIVDISVHKKPLIKNFINPDGSDFVYNKIESDTWNTGGNWADCWGGGGEYGSEEPDTFYQLMNILEKCNATHIYDEIITNLAIVEDDSESDYYGGCRYFSWYEIHLESLENYLRERGHLRNLLITDLVGDD